MTPTFVFRRHLWLVDLLYSYGPLNKEQIDKHWEKSSINDDRSKNIPRRTFIRMREAIFEIFGIEIACNKYRGNVYYIVGLDEIKNGTSIHYLLQLFSVSNLLQETQQIQSRILLENTPVAASHYLPIVVTALKITLCLKFPIRVIIWVKATLSILNHSVCVITNNACTYWHVVVTTTISGFTHLIGCYQQNALSKHSYYLKTSTPQNISKIM